MSAAAALEMPQSSLLLPPGKAAPAEEAHSGAKSRSTSAGTSPRPTSSTDAVTAGGVASGAITSSPNSDASWREEQDNAKVPTSISLEGLLSEACAFPFPAAIPPPPGLEDTWSLPCTPGAVGMPPGLLEEATLPALSAFEYLLLQGTPLGYGLPAMYPGVHMEMEEMFGLDGLMAAPPSYLPPTLSYAPPTPTTPCPPSPAPLSPPPAAAPPVVGLCTVARSLLDGPPTTHALGSAELPTVGSAKHALGICKPCAFFHRKGCENGVACQFCHLCEADEKKRRKQERRAQTATRVAKRNGSS